MSTTAEKRTYVVVGASSTLGQIIVERLGAAGHQVVPVCRSAGVALDDAQALGKAFAGADGAFLMIPFDLSVDDLHAREREIGRHLAEAVAQAGVRRAVLLSGLNAPLKLGSSLGAALMEERLEALGIPELVHLRAGFFMENFIKGLDFASQAGSGSFATPFSAERPMPMVAARDVGLAAAELLTVASLGSTRVQELRGAADYSMAEATAVLAAALGQGPVSYVRVPLEAAREGMLAGGMSASFADAVIETARSFNAGERWGTEQRDARSTTATTLESWAREAFRAASSPRELAA